MSWKSRLVMWCCRYESGHLSGGGGGLSGGRGNGGQWKWGGQSKRKGASGEVVHLLKRAKRRLECAGGDGPGMWWCVKPSGRFFAHFVCHPGCRFPPEFTLSVDNPNVRVCLITFGYNTPAKLIDTKRRSDSDTGCSGHFECNSNSLLTPIRCICHRPSRLKTIRMMAVWPIHFRQIRLFHCQSCKSYMNQLSLMVIL